MWGSETAETNLRTMLFVCYLQLLGVDVGERDCGDESADDAVPMLFAAVGGRCGGARLRRRIYGRCCLHALFAAVGGRCGGARLRRRICGCCCSHAICSCWGWMLGSETAETNLRTMLLPCYLQLLGVDVRERDCGDESADAAVCMLFAAVGGRCGGARLRRRICGRCFYHAICSCWGGGDGAADGGGGGCCCVNMRSLRGPDFGPLILEELGSETAETNLWTLLFACYLQLLGVDVGERDCGDESADDAVPMLFASICSSWG